MDIKELKEKVESLGSDTEYMSDDMLTSFAKHLRHEREVLLEANILAVKNIKERGLPSGDDADVSSENEELAKLHSEVESRKVQIRMNDRAIALIEKGDFGYCVDCGDEIGIGRMLARPSAVRDIECANAHDQKQRAATSKVAFY